MLCQSSCVAGMQAANTEYQIIKCIAQVHLKQTNWIIWPCYLTNNTRLTTTNLTTEGFNGVGLMESKRVAE
ncbi:hypothetical protein PFLUV_G00225420 [Perca fluviatilis]|uniref:Uncharacterized protein n=1 Tax=Perca fluviatilis TaxID=8168 RepID=A0A6A5DS57_PERFL|nr:hypothetical protein PFLUV_G00225420 [Perca fluviatilis]